MAISSYHQALSLDPSFTFCADMLNKAMEDASCFPSVLAADPHDDAERFCNFTRLSNYHLGTDPIASGELESHAQVTNQSFGGERAGNTTAFSGFPSEMRSPGFSLADSFSQIEGRLSVSARWNEDCGNTHNMEQNGSFISQDSYRSDHGGFLEDSFDS